MMGHVFWGLPGLRPYLVLLNQVSSRLFNNLEQMGCKWHWLHPFTFDDCIGLLYELVVAKLRTPHLFQIELGDK